MATQNPTEPPAQAMQDMLRAISLGPTGYSDAMRKNLAMDIQTGGAKPTSGMTKASAMPFGYKPVAATPDPLKALIAKSPAPTTPAPATPAPTGGVKSREEALARMGYGQMVNGKWVSPSIAPWISDRSRIPGRDVTPFSNGGGGGSVPPIAQPPAASPAPLPRPSVAPTPSPAANPLAAFIAQLMQPRGINRGGSR